MHVRIDSRVEGGLQDQPTITCPRFYVSGRRQATPEMLVLLNFVCFPLDFCPSGMIAGVSVLIEMVLGSMRTDSRPVNFPRLEKRHMRLQQIRYAFRSVVGKISDQRPAPYETRTHPKVEGRG